MSNDVKVLIVEDELITAESIKELLEEEDYEVTGIAADAATALRICNRNELVPQVVLCDINIKGDHNGIELAADLKKLYNCEIVFLTALSDSRILQSAFAADPVMYIVKPFTNTQLLVAVHMAFHRLLARQQLPSGTDSLQLTDREREIALLVAEGFSSKQISHKLSISIETVKTHRRRMLQKNNINSFPQLVYRMNNERNR
ncbi:response regulator transcription factor [Sediminibacterium ginsengisoli]|uniref:DNA-binding response regulator, NarL/FixJ family, contains REC and HTH domains n=1 Tax=Sediminibacterium ginsengisoli TaxID=413434 RepID=A0A1T4LFS2_9BACT|nr:response regulator transcription factor [Sediminibacterium ginsengisoli]SJZ53579.1 DNA-binding response regulator, NarL/FixJ family, contains REC and HTH domains [Sediminibacterium ginsengisoli]